MKIAIAQIKPNKGNIEKNIKLHMAMISLALTEDIDAIFFPELSITGYEPELANELKTEVSDNRFKAFQEVSNKKKIIIGLGVPNKNNEEVNISMFIFQSNTNIQSYSKQTLHEHETPFFEEGKLQVIIEYGAFRIAPAICYESLLESHLINSLNMGANMYVASVAKHQRGIEKAMCYFSKMAKVKAIPILMSNSIGHCDNFESAGQSAIWNKQGELLGQLSASTEGVLIYNTETEQVIRLEK